jgi:uncharacterized protein (DUF427 family)
MNESRRERPRPTESVWDYPRPPRVEESDEHVVVELAGAVVADSRRTLRVLETSHPPAYYIPDDDFSPGVLRPATGSSYCEFKGQALYLSLLAGGRLAESAAWAYPKPTPPFERLRGYVSIYPGRVDRCLVDGEPVRPQAGGFYGGWITSRVTGPFKGEPGTSGW